MKFVIKHEIKGRLRVHMAQQRMTYEQADVLQYYLQQSDLVVDAKVYEQTADVVISYNGDRAAMIHLLCTFKYQMVEVPEGYLESTGRELNSEYKEKLICKVVWHYGKKLILPAPIRNVITIVNGIRYIWKGLQSLRHRRLDVAVLDATGIAVSLLRQDMGTAGSVMFLLGIGELLEEWTHKKSVGDLARSMSLNVEKVWQKVGDQEILVSASTIEKDDEIIVHAGNIIPFDGVVTTGDATVNQASLTGESVPVAKNIDSYVYAGTVLEEGELTICVKATGSATKYEKIVTMIEDSEKLKSNLEGKAEHLADKLVPYTLGGTLLTWLLTRNVTKALSILMVDFSCALKLAMPISVLSAIREAGTHKVTVKGGKYLEAMADADTIVFDKTGTLTKAKPTVVDVVSFDNNNPDEMLRIAACMEEHFPHSMAKAVVSAARKKHLAHEEMHSKVEYVVAHGISTTIEEHKAVIGSYHFVFEDEKCVIPEDGQEKFDSIPEEYSHLYLAIDGRLAAVICIEDPLREEAKASVEALRAAGISKIVMMTGDSERTAAAIARRVGVDEYYSEVLPEDKANFIEKEKAAGRRVIMVGDGINDSPALSAANVGIAISDGAEIAREIADITVGADDLQELVVLKEISNALMKRIRRNYRFIITFNAGLIACGVAGILQPTTSALLHNTSTLAISLKSMQNLLP